MTLLAYCPFHVNNDQEAKYVYFFFSVVPFSYLGGLMNWDNITGKLRVEILMFNIFHLYVEIRNRSQYIVLLPS
jgi:hypothetical protein